MTVTSAALSHTHLVSTVYSRTLTAAESPEIGHDIFKLCLISWDFENLSKSRWICKTQKSRCSRTHRVTVTDDCIAFGDHQRKLLRYLASTTEKMTKKSQRQADIDKIAIALLLLKRPKMDLYAQNTQMMYSGLCLTKY